MSEDLEELLAREGHDDVDALMGWARERAAQLVPDLERDEELGPLLGAGGQAGAAPLLSDAAVLRVEPVALTARREASNAAPLPPIPVATPAVPTDELDVEEIEELDMEELEMVEEEEGGEDDEATAAGPAPTSPAGESAPPPLAAPRDDEVEANSFGPPDGNEHVPEWKAALLSTQTATDQEAAERVKEASSAGPLPEMPFPQGEAAPQSGRLEAEHDEVSQHSVDLSDLDTQDE
ncbi:MAG: hypothetical protein KUG77_29745 [Nannocystaceae bacterium]|nr:hypothetical protein [Nannocystaceae bacterium]